MRTITSAVFDKKKGEYKVVVQKVVYNNGVSEVITDEEYRKTVSPKMARDLVLPPSALRDLGLA